MNATNAKGATGILMNPETGEILAMASIPCFDSNNPGDYPLEYQKIKAITDQFEPGSTFKIVSATAALDKNMEGLMTNSSVKMEVLFIMEFQSGIMRNTVF